MEENLTLVGETKMASRIIFFPTNPDSPALYDEKLVEFDWVPGMAISQGTKSVINMHRAANNMFGDINILEISTRSPSIEGIQLSAFNLTLESGDRSVSVESAYQSSKVFELGGPYTDIMDMSSLDAKRDSRMKNSGKLLSFKFEGIDWPITESPNFYDYLYIRGLINNSNKFPLQEYDAFTDIAFSQISLKYKKGKSFNCQARSAAIYVSLQNRMPDSNIVDFLIRRSEPEANSSNQLGLFEGGL